MKKRFTLLLAAISAVAPLFAGLPTPWYSEVGNKTLKDIDPSWTLVSDGKGATWIYDGTDDNLTKPTGTSCGVMYKYDTKVAADDWIISPEVDLVAGTEYVLSFWAYDKNKKTECMDVYLTQSLDPAEITKSTPVKQYSDKSPLPSAWQKIKYIFTPDADGPCRVAFHVTTPANKWTLFLRGVGIKENKIFPAAVSGLTVTAAADKALAADLAWTLPTTDEDGNALASPLTAVNVYREDELIATLAGDATEFSDTDIPESGTYTYSVSAVLNGAEGNPVSVKSSWIGPKSAMSLPWSYGPSSAEDRDFFEQLWTVVDVAGDGSSASNSMYPTKSNIWAWETNMMNNDWGLSLHINRYATSDDWLITPPLRIPGAGTYRVSFSITQYRGSECDIDVMAGSSDTPDGMTVEIANIAGIDKSSRFPSSGEAVSYEFTLNAKGTWYIGLHAKHKSTSSNGTTVSVGKFNVELVSLSGPAAIEPPFDSATAEGWAPAQSLTFALEPGYYHAAYTLGGEASFEAESAVADAGFRDDAVVIKATEACDATFGAPEGDVFTAFAIAPADYTPAPAVDSYVCEYPDGTVEISWNSPKLTAAGEPLYEITEAIVCRNGEPWYTHTESAPGAFVKVTIPAPEVAAYNALSNEYSVAFRNLSGTGEPVVAQGIQSGVESVGVDAAVPARIYNISGIEMPAGATLPAGVYLKADAKGRKLFIVK